MKTQINYSDCIGNSCKKFSATGGLALFFIAGLSFAGGMYYYHHIVMPTKISALKQKIEAETIAKIETAKNNTLNQSV
jgi:hypothetical protein